ncbi:NAD-dependent succinate-semialdehyde dehydrogenase [Halotalea alkalilenta]|uniref:Succinate-semialdehyde dehydrogenase n=1 Tax=Halotalea alkalilenta TaxID=376489 RepID=A0A172YC21_9GAMM|nr:NAD-dependent succinate-semialdehyde dehydrogenase [Halotalea alkalilenta]ANF56555.1 succinate-semialdehyde dehydrogenase [Halotalea alkalilenta]
MTAAVSIDPHTGQPIADHPYLDDHAALARLAAADRAFVAWRDTPLERRVAALTSMAAQLRQRADRLADTMVAEMGKTLREAHAEVEKCARLCEWYAEHGPAMLADEPAPGLEGKAWIAYRPLGTVLAVMPWNFPLWQAMRNAVPILLSGNAYLLKPAPSVVGSATELAEAWRAAGLAEGLFELVNVEPGQVGMLIDDPRVRAVAVTASVRAGSQIAARAGAALKKSVLELGGSDPFVVLADADLDAAVEAAVQARFANAGQVCVAAKRIIVEAALMPAFRERFLARAGALKVGDPRDPATDIGPMARRDLRDELHGQVEKSIAQGARLLLGGEPLPGPGNHYPVTVLDGVTPTMVAFEEETFGPLAALIEARDAEHAIELANDSRFGLSGALWSADVERAKRLAARFESGGVFINGSTTSDPRVPIGGVKMSGYGRELSHFGIREFCNPQTVWLDRR